MKCNEDILNRNFGRMLNAKLSCLFLVVLSTAALAQFESATLTGIVTDPAGSLVPNAAVRAVNEATDIETSAVTNTEGRYVFPNLRPGSYQVDRVGPGFKQSVSSGVVLQVNQAGRLDVQLTVGAITEQVSVTSDTPMLETESASRGAVIDRTKMVELPLNGRDYNQLALLSPGVLAPTPRLQSVGFRGAFNVNGNRAFQNAFQLDGVDNTSYSNSFRGLNVQVVQPSVEALQEFKIQTNAYSAEFGRSAGALINAVIRSGTNKLHGSVYEFHAEQRSRCEQFLREQARGWISPSGSETSSGRAVGGPIVKDQTFIFRRLRRAAGRAPRSCDSAPCRNPSGAQGMFATPIWNPYNPNDTGQDFRIPATAGLQRRKRQLLEDSRQPHRSRRAEGAQCQPGARTRFRRPWTTTSSPRRSIATDRISSISAWITTSPSSQRLSADTRFPRPTFSGRRRGPGLAEGSSNDTFGTADLKSQADSRPGLVWVLTPSLVSETRFGLRDGRLLPASAELRIPDVRGTDRT